MGFLTREKRFSTIFSNNQVRTIVFCRETWQKNHRKMLRNFLFFLLFHHEIDNLPFAFLPEARNLSGFFTGTVDLGSLPLTTVDMILKYLKIMS